MNYELAKELKEAGFPQDGDNRDAVGEPVHAGNFGTGFAYVPTLEELIDACGYNFHSVAQQESCGILGWRARSRAKRPIVSVAAFSCLEAVARLWLALNKKA